MRSLLIGINDKNCSLRAVSYVMRHYKGVPDVDVTLVHVIPDLPATYWDDGHILNETEEQERHRVIGAWVDRKREYIEPILDGAARELVTSGFARERVKTRVMVARGSVADNLLDLAAKTGVKTVVIGRCGIADGKHFVVGSVVSKIIHQATDVAVCVVQ